MQVKTSEAIETMRTFIIEDRQDIRFLKGRIMTLLTGLLIGSFAITGFIYESSITFIDHAALYVDLVILGFLIFICVRSTKDLDFIRKAITKREKILSRLDSREEYSEVDFFPSFDENDKLDFVDYDMRWIMMFTILLLLSKMLLLVLSGY